MHLIKHYLYHHGEKLAAGLIALVCLWSLSGHLFSQPNVLPLPGGDVLKVEKDDVEGQIRRVKGALNSSSQRIPTPPIPEASRLVRDAMRQNARPVMLEESQWVLYLHPPRPTEFPEIKAPVEPPPDDPPEGFITVVGAPGEWAVQVGGSKALITCKDSPMIRYPFPDSVRVALFRRAVGEGMEEMTPEEREPFRTSTYEDLKASASTAASSSATSTKEEDPFFDFGTGDEPQPEKPKWELDKPEPEPAASDLEQPQLNAKGLPLTPRDYVLLQKQRERLVRERIEKIASPNARFDRGWRLLVKDMPRFRRPFNESHVKKIFEQGLPRAEPREEKLPAETATAAAATDAGAAAGEAEETPRADEGLGSMGGMEGLGGMMSTGTETGAAAGYGVTAPEYEPYHYAYLDEALAENTVYRYRLVAYAKARPLPKQILEKEPAFLSWPPRVEVGDLGATFLALPEPVWAQTIKNLPPTGKEAAPQPAFQPLYVLNPETGARERIPFVNEEGRMLPLLQLYRKEPGFSAFTYTDVVLTPIRTTMSFRSWGKNPDNTLTVNIYVTARAEDGTPKTKGFRLSPPPLPGRPEGLQAKDLLKIGPDGRAVLGENGRPVELDLAEVYGAFPNLQPTPIGEEEVIGGQEWDFRTGWGLVDIRECKVKRWRERYVQQKIDGVLQENPDGTPKMVWEAYSRPMEYDDRYLVVRELNPAPGQKPRYKRMPKYRRPPTQEDIRERFEFDWEPKLHKALEERFGPAGGETPTPEGDTPAAAGGAGQPAAAP